MDSNSFTYLQIKIPRPISLQLDRVVLNRKFNGQRTTKKDLIITTLSKFVEDNMAGEDLFPLHPTEELLNRRGTIKAEYRSKQKRING